MSPAEPHESEASGLSLAARQGLDDLCTQINPISVSFSRQLVAKRPQSDVLAALRINQPPNRFFHRFAYRVAWQDQKLYTYREAPLCDVIDGIEITFDGCVTCTGMYSSGKSGAPDLRKRFMSKVVDAEPLASLNVSYFPQAGISLPERNADWRDPRAEPKVLHLLRRGAVLKSEKNVSLDGHPHVRIELAADNPLRRFAEEIDVLSASLSSGGDEQSERKKELYPELAAERALPATRHYVFHLDPARGFAVRRTEELYEGGQQLRRCDGADFTKVGDRSIWLPRRCTTEVYEWGAQIFGEPIVTEHVKVSDIDGSRAPDSRFVLDYTLPGSRIHDETLPEAASHPRGFIGYTVPTRREDLDQVIAAARQR